MRRLFPMVLGIVFLALAAVAAYLYTFKPRQRPASTEKIEGTPARLERGRYLAEVVFGCFDCHSKHDLTRYGAPGIESPGQGGECVGATQGFPGQVCMSNITPDPETGLGSWSDGEIIRAVREGIDKDG